MRPHSRLGVALLVTIVVLGLQPVEARADSWFSASLGTLFGGSSGQDLEAAIENRSDLTYGVSLGGMRGGVVGGEFDLGFTPRFFGADSTVESSNLLTAHGSVLLGIPLGGGTGGGVRPYGVVGLGLIRRQVTIEGLLDDLSTSDFGYNVGFGLMGFFGDTFGLRGEYRYFRNFQADDTGFLDLGPGTFSTSRVSAGIVLRF